MPLDDSMTGRFDSGLDYRELERKYLIALAAHFIVTLGRLIIDYSGQSLPKTKIHYYISIAIAIAP